MGVAVVEVGDVWVGVLDVLVAVPVGVALVRPFGMGVLVVIVVAVLVLVLDGFVAVGVFVARAQRQRDAAGGERDGDGLEDGDALAQQGPGQERPKKGAVAKMT